MPPTTPPPDRDPAPAPTPRSSSPVSTTTTLALPHSHSHSHPHIHAAHRSTTPTSTPAPPPPPPDVIAFFDPASAGGGGPLVRIATQHSQREAERERRRSSGTSVRPTLFSLTPRQPSPRPPDNPVFEDDDDEGERRSDKGAKEDSGKDTAAMKAAVKDEKHLKEDVDKEDDCDECRNSTTVKDEEAGATPYVYPEGGYGWVVVAACTTLCGCCNGMGTAWGVYQEHYQNVEFPNASTSVISLGGTLQGFCMGFAAFLSGRMGDRFGFKRVLIVAALLTWIGQFSASYSHSLWSRILNQGFISGMGFGTATPLFMSIPSQWFYRRRGLASGITLGGSGLGGGIWVLAARTMISKYGPERTLFIFSFILLAAMLGSTFLLRTRPTSPEAGTGRGPFLNTKVMATSEFWSIGLSLVIGVIGYVIPYGFLMSITRHMFPELESMTVAVPMTIMAFMALVGRALAGGIADFLGPMNTYVLIFVLSGVVQLCVLLTASTFAQLCVFAVLYGILAPGYLGLIPQVCVCLFGPAELATNVGILLLMNSPGNLVSGPIGGAVYDSTGGTSYRPMIALAGSLQLLGGLIASWARWKASPAVFTKV